jgi:membrane associated rhomboid family serine protease
MPPTEKDTSLTGADRETVPRSSGIGTQEDYLPLPAEQALAFQSPEQALRICALVLEARGVPFQVPADPPLRVEVPASCLPTARRELALFAAENRDWPPRPPAPAARAENTETTLLVLALLALFHVLVHGGEGVPASEWLDRGLAAAGRILQGEWWRPLTALTLHADGLHLLANLLLGAPLVVRLCRMLGSGLGWGLVLATGGLGNLSNALLQEAGHRSLGSSTALFGTLGLLAGLALVARQQARLPRWLLPVAAALALLALLGTGTGNVDVEAHLCGFFWGLVLGVPAGYGLDRRGRPGPATDRLLALACAVLLTGAWWVALHTG